MRKGTAAFEAARLRGDPVYVRLDFTVDGLSVASTEDTAESTLVTLANQPVLSYDASAAIVTAINTLELVIPDELVPADSFGLLSPLNNTEVIIETGYLIGGTPETYPAAVMNVESIRLENHGDGRKVYLDLFDRAKALERSVYWRPREIPAGAHIPEVINAQLQDVYPQLELVSPAIETGAAAMEIGDTRNRLSVIRELAASVGHTFMFDAVGDPILVPPPLDGADPALSYSSVNNDFGELLSVCRELTRQDVYNGVILHAQSTRQSDLSTAEAAQPLYAEAWADNIISPISYTQADAIVEAPGAFPLIRDTQMLTSADEVRRAARAAADLLALQPERLSLTVRPQPGLELMDVISIDEPDIGASGIFTVGAMTRPLGADWLGLGCNERRIA